MSTTDYTSNDVSVPEGKDEKLRLTNLEWGVDFLRLTNLVKTSLDGQI